MGLGPIAYLLLGELVPPQVKGESDFDFLRRLFVKLKFIRRVSFVCPHLRQMVHFVPARPILWWDVIVTWNRWNVFPFRRFLFRWSFLYSIFVPETKGKTLSEIQEGFATRSDDQTRLSERTGLLASESMNEENGRKSYS